MLATISVGDWCAALYYMGALLFAGFLYWITGMPAEESRHDIFH